MMTLRTRGICFYSGGVMSEQHYLTNLTGGRDPRNIRFHLSREDIKADLTDQRPTYPLSCYGPGRDAPRQLIEGPVEISPEELRSRYYSYRATGNEAVAVGIIFPES